MRIKKIELKNFKRFTDLTILEIPESSKLVLLIGSNGSGKSCLFDAFDAFSKIYYKEFETSKSKEKFERDQNYYAKDKKSKSEIKIEVYDTKKNEKIVASTKVYNHRIARKFIGRSSIRIVPKITNQADIANIASDLDSPESYIDQDYRFNTDAYAFIQKINYALRDPLFKGEQADSLKIFNSFIDPINQSLANIFGGDENTAIRISQFEDATPNKPATLIFKKGSSEISYELLSHGEKQVIILLINFIVRKESYEDSIIFIDEMDCHLNTALQYSLLEEIVTRWIPENSQLWTASHALGFIDYAKKSENACTIDFDLLNFDHKQEILPLSKNKLDVYEIVIPKATITEILKGYKLVIVENQNDEYFNLALGKEGFLFLPANNNREVFLTVKQDSSKLGLRDRDYLRNDEILQIQEKMPALKILYFSTFENYIYHPDNLEELNLDGFNKDEYIAEIIKQKNEKILEIASEIATSRQHYIEFKDCIKNDEKIDSIINALKSDDLKLFYPFFNMKKHCKKNYLDKLKYEISSLVKTKWFKEQIANILK